MVLDSEPEAVFDSIARLASEVCCTPIALLSLVDAQRQWFKANVGLPGVNETPRDQAFCAHAIHGEAVFEVRDATRDERFADNPLVMGDPHIAFYAGAPLVLPSGARIGTLCVIDREARELTPTQTQWLQSLAAIASQALVMRQQLIVKALSVRGDYERVLVESEAKHRALVEDQAEMVSLARADGTLVYANRSYARLFGGTPAQLVGRSLLDYVEQADRPAVRALIGEVMRSGETRLSQNRMVSADGNERWVEWTNSLQLDTKGQPVLHSVGRDVTERHKAVAAESQAQAQLQRQTATLHGVIEAIPAMITVYGADQRIRFVNRALERSIGHAREEIIGRGPAEVFGQEAELSARPMANRALGGETVAFETTVSFGGHLMHLALSFIPLRLANGAVDGFVSVAQDITQHKQEEVRLLQLAQRDALTGLFNRAGFERFLEDVLAEDGGSRLALLYIDLDKFKPVNDQHGHPVGDEVLRQFGQRLRAAVRPSDAVARLGGDEFAIALAGLPDAAHARVVADKVLAAAHAPFQAGALMLQVGASVGVAFGTRPGQGWRQLVERADALLYRAKGAGRGRQVGEACDAPLG